MNFLFAGFAMYMYSRSSGSMNMFRQSVDKLAIRPADVYNETRSYSELIRQYFLLSLFFNITIV